MSSDEIFEVLDANIVIIPEKPLPQTANPLSLFERSDLAMLMRKPLTIGQGINLDTTIGAVTGMLQIESMKSQKTVSLGPLRIEVHDRSGKIDLEGAKIPKTAVVLVDALSIKDIGAVGANWEIVFKSPEGISAGVAIAEKLLYQNTSFLPNNISPIGGGVRLFLSDDSGVMYTLAVEPRGQNVQTNDLWMSCNAHVANPENLSIGLLKDVFQQSYNLLLKVKESLFPFPEFFPGEIL
jgi:hypothetical protein